MKLNPLRTDEIGGRMFHLFRLFSALISIRKPLGVASHLFSVDCNRFVWGGGVRQVLENKSVIRQDMGSPVAKTRSVGNERQLCS